jgi:FMN-dependent NADH-azoreductase
MTTLLHISASARGNRSYSRLVAHDLIAAIEAEQPDLRVLERDLLNTPVPHVDAGFTAASLMPEAQRGETEERVLAFSEELISELQAADILVVSAPMHNFAPPSALKAWLDHIVRPGRTFAGTPSGKVGLLSDRPAYAVIACGGRLSNDGSAQTDFFSPYLRYVLGTIGLTGLEILRLTEMNRGQEKVESAFLAARGWVDDQVARLRLMSAEAI